MLLEEITKLLGEAPPGYEGLTYVAMILIMLYLLDCFYGVLRMLIGHFLR